MRKWVIYILSLFLVACEEVVIVDLPDSEGLLVVEGWIYNQEGPQEVQLSRSVPFYSSSSPTAISDAVVFINDNFGNSYLLTETSPGVYHTDSSVMGILGRLYSLEIQIDERRYRSDFERLKNVPVIDSIAFGSEFVRDPDNPFQEILEYFPIAFVDEPDSEADYYRWKVYQNGVLFNEPEDIVLQTDRFINGNAFQNELKEFRFNPQDSVSIELLSLTRESYDFFRLFVRQTTDLGTASGTSPAILRGNIRNEDNPNEDVIGYFGASAITSSYKIVQE
ncbi:MAG: DUF4249 domain-containing protein [bacterium]|nr:DUF4249 domain-containing protein [bacterium]